MAKAKKSNVVTNKSSFLSGNRNVAIVLGVFAFCLYAKTISFGYALDDVAVLKNNNYVQDGFGGFGRILSTFYWQGNDAFATSNSGLFRPMSLLMFATEWQMFGNNPQAFHFIHVLLYALVSFQLFLWLSEMLGKDGRRIAIIGTVLWIVLPIHTEVVANLKSADELLSLLFSILGFRLLLKWNDSKSALMLAGFLLSFFFALLSKEAAVLTIPIALLMLMMFRNRSVKELLTPGLTLLVVSLVWFFWHYSVIANSDSARITYDYRHNALYSSDSGIDQLGTAIGLQARYWVKMLIGYPLSYNYSFNQIPVNGFADLWPWLSLIGIGAAGFFAVKKFKSDPIISFSIIFYFVTMALTSNIFIKIGDIFAERFTFVPSIAFCLLIAILILRFSKSEIRVSTTTIGIVVVLCLAYSIRTFARSADWSSEEALFIADAENSPNSGRVHDNVGAIKMNAALGAADANLKRTLFDEAFEQYTIAFDIDARDYQAAAALGQILYHKADYKSSVAWSERSISIRRQLILEQGDTIVDDWNTLQNTGDAFVKMENYDSAFYYYAQSGSALPRADAFMRMGDTRLRAKDTAEAIAQYSKAVEFDSTYSEGWDKIGNLNGMMGNYAASNVAFERLARINPQDPNPWKMIYTNYNAMGDTVRAAASAKEYYNRGGK
jgi:hypothetical protein